MIIKNFGNKKNKKNNIEKSIDQNWNSFCSKVSCNESANRSSDYSEIAYHRWGSLYIYSIDELIPYKSK